MNTLTSKIGGRHCSGCGGRLSALLEKEPGVREANVSFATGEGQLAYSAHAVGEERLIAAIEGAGFGVEKT